MSTKALLFIVGILLGLIGGGLAVYISTGASVKNIFVVNEQKPDPVKPDADKTIKPDPSPIKAASPRPASPAKTTTGSGGHNENILPTLHEEELKVINFNEESDEDIVVKTDELIQSYTIPLLENKEESSDTLAGKAAGIQTEQPRPLTIEYWKSPINYRGYKMGKSKLILFGLQETEHVKAIKIDEIIYLRHNQKVFRITPTSSFRPFEIEVNESILEQIETL